MQTKLQTIQVQLLIIKVVMPTRFFKSWYIFKTKQSNSILLGKKKKNRAASKHKNRGQNHKNVWKKKTQGKRKFDCLVFFNLIIS